MIDPRETQDACRSESPHDGRALKFFPPLRRSSASRGSPHPHPVPFRLRRVWMRVRSPPATTGNRKEPGSWQAVCFAAFSTAIAATIALCAFFSLPRTAARRWLRRFCAAGSRASRLSFELDNIQVEGVHLDGRVQIVFPTAITLKRLVEEDETLPSRIQFSWR